MRPFIAVLLLILHLPLMAAVAEEGRGLAYQLNITGVDNGLKRNLTGISLLMREAKTPPGSYGALASRIETDIKGFQKLLRSEGYYDARISRSIDGDQTPLGITIAVDAGPRYSIETIAIRLLDRPEDTALLDLLEERLTLAPGDPVVARAVVTAESRIAALLPQHGHPLLRTAARRVVIDHSRRSARITYRFEAGPEVRFGELRFEDLESVRADYLGRFIPWEQGALYDQAKVERFRRQLMGMRLFGAVAIRLDGDPESLRQQKGRIEPALLVRASEADHKTISGGIGFSTSEGFGVEAGWQHRNLFGASERLDLTARIAEIEQSLTALLTKPNFRREDQELSFLLSAKRQDTDAFDSLELEGRVGLDRRIGRRWTFGVATELAFNSIEDSEGRRAFLLASLPLSASYDSRDNLLDPTRGIYARASAAPYLAFQNSPFSFYRHELEGGGYLSLHKNDDIILAARAGVGVMHGAALERLPANRRFFAGGGGSVRGFGFQNVGPVDADGDPTGGRSLFEASFEARFRVIGSFGLVPFIDAGQVWDDSLPQFDGLRYGAGLGFRWHTDFAPIRFDIATPLNRRPGEDRIQFYISLGQSF